MAAVELQVGSRVVTEAGIPGVISSFSFCWAWVRVASGELRYERISTLVAAGGGEVV